MTQRVAHRSRSRTASKSAAPFGDRRYSTATGRPRWTFRCDPNLLEFLQRLRERALAHARRHAQLVEAFRSGEEAVEDRELELGADHLEGDHRAARALARAFLLRHGFASLHYIM